MTQRMHEHEFITSNVPRLHQALMLMFPICKSWFNYSIARNEEDKTKLTLLRNKKVLARSFTTD